MTKTIKTDWKGSSRRIKLRDPGEKQRLHHLTAAPNPLKMSPSTLAWINATITMGSELEMESVESMYITDGIHLLSEVIGYWKELQDEESESSDKGVTEEETEFEGIDLNEDGAVDLDEMQ